MLNCIGLLGRNKALWLYCFTDGSETYSYADFPVGMYHWSDEGQLGELLYIQQIGQSLITTGLRRLKHDEAPEMYALAGVVEKII